MEASKEEFPADGKILDRWGRLIEAGFAERKSALPEQVNQTLEEFAAMGNAGSGGAYKRVRAVCDSEINKRGDIVLQSLKRVHGQLGFAITEGLAKKLKDEAGDYVEAIVREISEYMAKRRPMSKLEESFFDFEDTKREVKKRIDVELDLYFDSVGEAKNPAETGRDIAPGKGRRIRAWFKTFRRKWVLVCSVLLLIVLTVLSLLIPDLQPWFWRTAVIPFVMLILSLLGGRTRS